MPCYFSHSFFNTKDNRNLVWVEYPQTEKENLWFNIFRALKEVTNNLSTHDNLLTSLYEPYSENSSSTARDRTHVLGVGGTSSTTLHHSFP